MLNETVRKKMKFSALSFSVVALSLFAGSVHAEEDMAPLDAFAAEVKQDEARGPASSETEVATTPEAESVEAAAPKNGRTRPSVKQTPFESEGFWLNAYYFVREKGETWAGLSEKLYGRSDRTELLRKWNNSQRLRVGDLVYYNSPSRPDDSGQMKVFAEDFGAKLEEHVVTKDESLSKIGHMSYGDFRTWKEIAALNPNIANPDVIEVGQKIRLQPRSVDTHAVLNDIVSAVKVHDQGDEKPATDQNTQIDQVAQNTATDVVTPTIKDTPVTAAASTEMPPPAAAPPAAPVAPAPVAAAVVVPTTPAAPETPVVASVPVREYNKVHSAPPAISFKASSILGLMGTCLLVLSVGMIVMRKFPKKKASSKSDNLTNIPTNRNSPV